MRILVVGAGAIGGYFGGRLIEAGRDVTFLVRPQRARELAASGLVIESPAGDAVLRGVKTLLAEELSTPFDLVILTCKAYDLDGAIRSFAPAVGPSTMILPLLNGMRHLDLLDERFGRSRVLGGQCVIAVTLDKDRRIVELNDMHAMSFGERDGGISERVQAIAAAMQGAKFEARASADVVAEMWAKWVFLAALAGGTCLFRAPVGDIVAAPGGAESLLALLDECAGIAQANGYPQTEQAIAVGRKRLSMPGSAVTASMLRDIESGSRTETDHVIGDLLERAARPNASQAATPILRLAYTHLKAHEARHARLAEQARLAREGGQKEAHG